MGVYDREIAMAVRMIKAKGQLCQWVKPGAVTGTPAKPISGVPEKHDCHIVFLPNKRDGLSSFLSMFPDAPDVPTGGMRGLMAAVPFEPLLTDTVERGSEVLGLMDKNGIDALNVNGEPILFYLRFTR